jgi:hypothetical protein
VECERFFIIFCSASHVKVLTLPRYLLLSQVSSLTFRNKTVFLNYKLFTLFFYNSRGSSVSSDDFSSLASPDSTINDKTKPNRAKLRQKSKNTKNMEGTLNMSGSTGSGRGGSQIFLKRRYSVPEIIMRK